MMERYEESDLIVMVDSGFLVPVDPASLNDCDSCQ